MTVIDISYWQGHPDFAQVNASGPVFRYARLTVTYVEP